MRLPGTWKPKGHVLSTMSYNNVYPDISEDKYSRIKDFLKVKGNFLGVSKLSAGVIDSFSLTLWQEKVTFTYYRQGKLMIQGSSNSTYFNELIADLEKTFEISTKHQLTKITPTVDELQSDKKFFIGFDESGAGESFGSLFLGCAIVEKSQLPYLKEFLGKKNIKRLEKFEVYNLFNDLKGRFKCNSSKISAWELDDHNKNRLLDREYEKLLSSLTYEPSGIFIVVDDYNIGIDLRSKLASLQDKGATVVLQNKADENYVGCMLASLTARKKRLEEMEVLKKENALIDPDTGSKVFFESGAAGNPEVEKWIRVHRQTYPYSPLPAFVRMKWKNIQRLEEKYPKLSLDNQFECEACNTKTNKLLFFYCPQEKVTEMICSNCGNIIPAEYFTNFMGKPSLIVDTSAILDRIISKDLSSTMYLKGSTIVIPSLVYDEIDRKPKDRKKGGQNEIDYLEKANTTNTISLKQEDVDDHRDIANDHKFMYLLKVHEAVMLTKDKNMAAFSQIGKMVIEVIQEKPTFIQKPS